MITQETSSDNRGLVALNKWQDEIGVTPVTTWRWRKRGWINTVNICGRVYISKQTIADFTRRAEAGEFAQEHKAPGREVSK